MYPSSAVVGSTPRVTVVRGHPPNEEECRDVVQWFWFPQAPDSTETPLLVAIPSRGCPRIIQGPGNAYFRNYVRRANGFAYVEGQHNVWVAFEYPIFPIRAVDPAPIACYAISNVLDRTRVHQL